MFKIAQKEYWYVVAAGILSGLIVFGGKIFSNLGLSLYQISTLPFIVVVIFFLPFILLKKECRLNKKIIPILLLFGLVNALVALAEFGPVVLGVPVAIAVLLIYTQPFWTVIFSWIFMKEKITWRNIIALIIVIVGALILVNPFSSEIKNWPGIIVALLGGILLSAWIVVGSYTAKHKIHPISTLFFGRLFMLFVLLVFYPLFKKFISDPAIIKFSFNLPFNIWIYIIIFGIFALVVNNLFYLNGVKKVSTVDAGIIVMLEPVSAAILAAIFLHQPITMYIIIGGALILLANYLVIGRK